jgi:hypothetical protein
MNWQNWRKESAIFWNEWWKENIIMMYLENIIVIGSGK